MATLFSRRLLEDAAFCPDNVLGVPSGLWEPEAAAGGGRELGQSSRAVPERSFLLPSSLTPGAGPGAPRTGRASLKNWRGLFKGRDEDF